MRSALPSLLLLTACAGASMQARPARPGHDTLRVVTYNVNYGIPGDASTMRALADAAGEVVLLQETNPAWEAALVATFQGRYPHARFEHRPAAGGIGILSVHPIESLETVESEVEGGWFPALRAVVRVRSARVQLLNVHLRPQVSDGGSVVSGYFSTPSVREAEMKAFVDRLDPNLPTIVAGDFNESTSGAATDYLAERGFADAVDQLRPGEATWRWPTSLGEISSTLDRVMYRPEDGITVIDANVLTAGRSDHLPVITVFELPVSPDRR